MSKGIEAYLEILNSTDELKPVVKKTIKAIRELSPDIVELLGDIGNYVVDARAKSVIRLMSVHGFSEETAVMLTLDIQSNILNSLNKQNKGIH